MPLLNTSASDYTAFVRAKSQTLTKPAVTTKSFVAIPIVSVSAIVKAAAVTVKAAPTTTVVDISKIASKTPAAKRG